MRTSRSIPAAVAAASLVLGILTGVAPAASASEPAPAVSAKVKCVNSAGYARYAKSGACKRTERRDRKTCAKGGSCVVGDIGPGRGRVFYSARTQQPWGRYLEAAPNTWNSREGDPNVTWCSNVVDSIAGTQATGLGDGRANTAAMLGVCTFDAAVLAVAYRGGGKADWYLPSRDELRTLFLRSKRVGPFIFHGYWSSSESAPDQAWMQDFYLDAVLQTTEKGYANYVRPVRAF